MEEKKNNKNETSEGSSVYDVRISQLNNSVSRLVEIIYSLEKSIGKFNEESSKYSKRMLCLTIILSVLALIQAWPILLQAWSILFPRNC